MSPKISRIYRTSVNILVHVTCSSCMRQTSERELEDIFVKFGKVTEARLAVDKFNGRPKGFAFVTMEDARDAADACKELVDHELNGRVMRVEVSHGMGGARRRDDRSGYRGGGYRDRGRDRSRDRRDRSRDRDYGRGRDRSRDRDYRRDRRRSRSRSHSRGRR